MKSIFVTFFISIYLIASTGLLFSTHYCCGELQHISFFSIKAKSCCEGKKDSKGCCKDETTYLKVKDDQQQTADELPSFISPVIIIAENNFVESIQVGYESYYIPLLITDPPPLGYKTPIYIKNRVLRI